MMHRWTLCEKCGHGRICHSPEPGGGWRCRFHHKHNGEPCDCMRYRGRKRTDEEMGIR